MFEARKRLYGRYLIVTGVLLLAQTAHADWYIGVDTMLLNFDLKSQERGGIEEYDLLPARLKYGVFNPQSGKGIEFQVLTASDDTQTAANDRDYRVNLDTSVAAFFKYSGQYAYMMGGFSQLNTRFTYIRADGSESVDEDNIVSLAAGIGGHYEFARNFRVSADYVFYLVDSASYPRFFTEKDPELSVSGLSIGLNYSF